MIRPFKLLLLALFWLCSATAAQDSSTVVRYVISYSLPDIPGPFGGTIEAAIQVVADRLGLEFEIVLELDIPGLSLIVNLMPPSLAKALLDLPFVDIVETDQKVFFELPNNSSASSDVASLLSSEQTPYGIGMVGATRVSDSDISNKKVCIIDTGYDINHVDLPSSKSTVTGSPSRFSNIGPWDEDVVGHVSIL